MRLIKVDFPTPDEPSNGRVVSIAFLGPISRVHCELDDGQEVLGSTLPRELLRHRVGITDTEREGLAKAVGALPETELVQVDTAWVTRLRAPCLPAP